MRAVTLFVLPGIGEITPGTDVAAVILAAAGSAPDAALQPGDILAVTSKIVSKAEGRQVLAADREQAITDETVRVVASRKHAGGVTRIVENKLGIVAAAAGVDNSNTPADTVLLLPVDPDASARALCARLRRELGFDVGVIITDTLGRAWREGQTDAAIGAAGIEVLTDLRGTPDSFGQEMRATMTAVADEIAAAADLVKGKTSQCPVAVLRGLPELVLPGGTGAEPVPGRAERAEPVPGRADAGARSLIRPAAQDLFRQGSAEAWRDGYAAACRDAGLPVPVFQEDEPS
ncbi:coenzyme F420-0:L-glutamate ligase [Arthrobacter jiangjiafuii]|uniref:Coenzyme F420-0:L-glutamate ligase n=1 Tax=Arthrobacter jiangjiafuii TaxID=2817475 RepID=A0A975M6C7_9MICC|nr:coenzyme F420-0:L-glutamate ligase [Arthrobacter jiangjiafuii]MBP3045006.1 coenzyme F420-0:L-glutamate ligase [Arthrobacter jiangjiafuii]QWC10665.1 coenzyme F420-0:L-glutamate ligase [Arthrobacter jiangjiafuii]